MRSLHERLRRLEVKLPPAADGGFDIERAMGFRIAGLTLPIIRARIIVVLHDMATRPGCPDDVREECKKGLAEIIPVFLNGCTDTDANDPLHAEERHRFVLNAAGEIAKRSKLFAAD